MREGLVVRAWRSVREWMARFAAMFRKRQLHDRLEIELALHRELLAEDLAAAGSSANVDRELGPSSFRDAYDDRAGIPSIENLWRDSRYALRAMRRAPSFSLVVIVTLALGIGVTTAIFSVVHAVLLKPLPYPAAERLVWLGERTGSASGISITWPNFTHWRDGHRSFETIAAFQSGRLTLTGDREALTTNGMYVTADYFPLLGIRPLLGRLFAAHDDRPGVPATVVLSHQFWSGALGADPTIVGTALTLDGQPYEVAGVAAPVWEMSPVDVYLPLGRQAGSTVDRSRHGSMRALARLKPGTTLAAARDDLDAIMRHLAEVDPGPETDHRSYGMFLSERVSAGLRTGLLVLMAAATLVLLVACANVASLLLARGTTRGREFAVRMAIGAGRGRLVRQLLTESAIIAIVGGTAGLLVAEGTRRLLVALGPALIPRLAETALDLPVLLFASAITLGTGMIAGLMPVMAASRLDLLTALKDAARGSDGGPRRHYARSALVIGEIALTFILVFGCGLLLRSLIAAQQSHPGFEPANLLSLELRLPRSSYDGADAIRTFHTRLAAELRAIPGVTDVGAVQCPPGTGGCSDWFYSIHGRPAPARNEVPIALFTTVDVHYFRTAQVPLREGRAFTALDRATSPKTAIVNEALARRWWPGESAIGQVIKVGGPYVNGPLLEIVGVAADVRQGGLDGIAVPEIYQPFAQAPNGAMAVMIRTAGDPGALAPAVRRAVAMLDRNLPIQRLATAERLLDAGLAGRRFGTLLLTAFAVLGVVLAIVGIYGLLSYWVGIREREIAIRMALGARPVLIMRWTGAQALRLASIGIALGAIGGWAAARGLERLVFGIPSRSPAMILAAALTLAAIALLAAAIPAMRAARVGAAGLHQS